MCNRLPSPFRLPLASRLCDLLGVVTGLFGECFADRVDLFDDGIGWLHTCYSMAAIILMVAAGPGRSGQSRRR